MFDRFTDRAKKVVSFAQMEARALRHEFIKTEHLLLGLLREGSGVAANVLKNMNLDLDIVRRGVEKLVEEAEASQLPEGQLPFSKAAKRVFELAMEEASQLSHNYIGTEHLILGLIREGEGRAAIVLRGLDVKLEEVREEVLDFLGASEDYPEDGEEDRPLRPKTPALDSFGLDLTNMARDGRLDEVVGREVEIESVIQVLSRRTCNSAVLVGEAGTGKTAIIEAIARFMAENRISGFLSGKRLIALDLPLLVAGTKNRGQFEERIGAVRKEVARSKDVVLVIEDLQMLLAAGGAEESLVAADILRGGIVRDEIRCIGTVTPGVYRKHVQHDAEFARLFYPVPVNPPEGDSLSEILRGTRARYERHHGVRICDDAIERTMELARLYLPTRQSPARELGLLDEAAARVSLGRSAQEVAGGGGDESSAVEERALPAPGETERAMRRERAKAEQEADAGEEARNKLNDLLSEQIAVLERARRDDAVRLEFESGFTVMAADIVATLSRITEIPAGRILAREEIPLPDGSSPAHSGGGVPPFERLQTGSILLGQGVSIERGTGFVLLPHTEEFQAIFDFAIRPAMESNGLRALKADDIYAPGAILAQVWNRIRRAEVVVADLSGLNTNVIYELGLCFGVQRCPILLVRDESELPFNLRNLRYIVYADDAAGSARLQSELREAIRRFLIEVRNESAE